MRLNTRRGRFLVLSEPLGIVRIIGTLLLICAMLSLTRGLLMIHWHEEPVGTNNPKFWLYMSLATAVLGIMLSSPPRWRWEFDIDMDRISSYRVTLNVKAADGQTFPFSGLERAEVVKSREQGFRLELVDSLDSRIAIIGIQSRRQGLPNLAAMRVNELIATYRQRKRGQVVLNDPGVSLREAGILIPTDPLVRGQAVDALYQTLTPEFRDSLTSLPFAYNLIAVIAAKFQGALPEGLKAMKASDLTDLQLLLLVDLTIPVLNRMQRSQFVELQTFIDRPNTRRLSEGIYAFALSSRFARYVAASFESTSVELPEAEDLRRVLPECKAVIATAASLAHAVERPLVPPRTVDGREVVYVSANGAEKVSLVTKRAYDAGLDELSSGMTSEWTNPLQTAKELFETLERIKTASPVPMRNVFVRACARAAIVDGITESREWILIRAIADTLSVSVPQFVAEPVSEARVIEFRRHSRP